MSKAIIEDTFGILSTKIEPTLEISGEKIDCLEAQRYYRSL